jgi:hypothetical protein
MTDLFGDLARRSFGRVPVAEPRLASRFEPTAWDAPRLLANDNDAEPGEAAATGPEGIAPSLLPPIRSEPAPVGRPSIDRLPPRPKPADASRSESVRPASSEPRMPDHGSEPPSRPVIVRVSPALAESTQASPVESDRRAEPSGAPPPFERPHDDARLELLAPAPNRSGDAPRPPGPRGTAPADSSRSVVQSTPAIPLGPAPRLLPTIVREPRELRRRSAARDEATIQITIGRVEVRAVSDARPTRAPRVSTPMLTLEQYLERRGSRARE